MSNRVIKFRAWDEKAKQMSDAFHLFGEFTLLGAVHDWQRESGIEGDSLGRLNDLKVMQFTGLLDSEGKEIYESDILNHGDNFPSVVFWDVGLASFRLREVGIVKGEFAPREHDINYLTFEPTIKGNVYQSPELLNP